MASNAVSLYERTMIFPHSYHPDIERHPEISGKLADGKKLDFISTAESAFTLIDGDEAISMVLQRAGGWRDARVKPASAKAKIRIDGKKLHLDFPAPRPVMIETPGAPLVFIFAGPPAGEPPKPKRGGRLIRFAAGEVHQAGTIDLLDGDVLWLDAGAWVRGHVLASMVGNVVIGGRGVLDGSWRHPSGLQTRPILFDHCEGVRVSDITMVRPQTWMLTLGACEGVRVKNIQQIGEGPSTDGIDIAGSRDVRIRGCFLRNGDDNIAIKALDVKGQADPSQDSAGEFDGDWTGPVHNVQVENCAFYNDQGGSAMEIGYETRTDRISDIVFRNIDVMAVHRFGSVFAVHNGDRAIIENVLWENIRVEHHYDKLIDFRVLNSRWNYDTMRGHIKDIILRRIRVDRSPYNEGYTTSLIGGWDKDHIARNITIEDSEIGGKRIRCADDIDLFTRHCDKLRFR
jgi:hypothetical protein